MSRKCSPANAVCVWPTERHQSPDAVASGEWSSTFRFGTAYGISAAPSTEVVSIPFTTTNASSGVPVVIDCVTTRCRHALGSPSWPSVASIRWTVSGRYFPACMSSSRLRTSLTGTSSPIAASTASIGMSESGVARRPKPPPASSVWIVTFSGPMPSRAAMFPVSTVANWVPIQSSASPSRTWAVAFSGSMGACARNGTRKTPWIIDSDCEASTVSASPWSSATAPGVSASSW